MVFNGLYGLIKLIELMMAGEKKTGCVGRHNLFLFQGKEVLRFFGLHVDELATLFAGGEHHDSVDESEESVILAHTHVETGVVNCATLTLDDVTGFAMLTAENLYTESFAF